MLVDNAERCDKSFGTISANVLHCCIAVKSINKIESQVFEQRTHVCLHKVVCGDCSAFRFAIGSRRCQENISSEFGSVSGRMRRMRRFNLVDPKKLQGNKVAAMPIDRNKSEAERQNARFAAYKAVEHKQ